MMQRREPHNGKRVNKTTPHDYKCDQHPICPSGAPNLLFLHLPARPPTMNDEPTSPFRRLLSEDAIGTSSEEVMTQAHKNGALHKRPVVCVLYAAVKE